MEGMLEHIVGSALHRSASADEKTRIAAWIVAESLRSVNIGVTSSSDIGGSFPVNGEFIFRHENCRRVSLETRTSFTIEEDVRNICGEHSIVLYYEYQRDPFAFYWPGQIRLVDAAGARCLKFYESDSTVAFRYDDLLSHLTIMRGFQCRAPAYSLPPGCFANW